MKDHIKDAEEYSKMFAIDSETGEVYPPQDIERWDIYVTGSPYIHGCRNDNTFGPFKTEKEAIEFYKESQKEKITINIIRELIESDAMGPILIRFHDTGKLEVIPSPWLTDISWCDKGRGHTVITSQYDLVNADYGKYSTDQELNGCIEYLNS